MDGLANRHGYFEYLFIFDVMYRTTKAHHSGSLIESYQGSLLVRFHNENSVLVDKNEISGCNLWSQSLNGSYTGISLKYRCTPLKHSNPITVYSLHSIPISLC